MGKDKKPMYKLKCNSGNDLGSERGKREDIALGRGKAQSGEGKVARSAQLRTWLDWIGWEHVYDSRL